MTLEVKESFVAKHEPGMSWCLRWMDGQHIICPTMASNQHNKMSVYNRKGVKIGALVGAGGANNKTSSNKSFSATPHFITWANQTHSRLWVASADGLFNYRVRFCKVERNTVLSSTFSCFLSFNSLLQNRVQVMQSRSTLSMTN